MDTACSLGTLLAKKEDYYRIYFIKKSNGKRRQICEPIGDIIHWQQKIKDWLNDFPIHEAAHGFRLGRSIITNAIVHANQNYVLNIDLKDFFPSVSSMSVYKLFLNYISENGIESIPKDIRDVCIELASTTTDTNQATWIAQDLSSLCTLNGSLPQGACTSPALANSIVLPLDFQLYRLAESQKLNYSRYADDITFSGDSIPKWLVGRVRGLVEQHGLTVNTRKIKLMPYYQRQVVTGIVVNNDDLGVSKKVRNSLRQHLHFLRLKEQKIDESTEGLLEFIRSVKPSQYESLMKTYRGEYEYVPPRK